MTEIADLAAFRARKEQENEEAFAAVIDAIAEPIAQEIRALIGELEE